MNYFTGKKIIIVTKSNQMIHKNLYSKSGSIAVPVLECLSFTPAFSLSTNHRDFNANVKYITRLFNILQTLSSNICKFLKQFLTIKRGGPLLYYQQRNHQESIPLVWILRGEPFIKKTIHQLHWKMKPLAVVLPPKLHGTPLSPLQFYQYHSNQQHKSLPVYLGNSISNMAWNRCAQKSVPIVTRKDNRENKEGLTKLPDTRLSTCTMKKINWKYIKPKVP